MSDAPFSFVIDTLASAVSCMWYYWILQILMWHDWEVKVEEQHNCNLSNSRIHRLSLYVGSIGIKRNRNYVWYFIKECNEMKGINWKWMKFFYFFIFLRCLGVYRRRKWNENTFDIMPIIFYLYCKEMNIKCNSSQSIREKDVSQRLGGMHIEA